MEAARAQLPGHYPSCLGASPGNWMKPSTTHVHRGVIQSPRSCILTLQSAPSTEGILEDQSHQLNPQFNSLLNSLMWLPGIHDCATCSPFAASNMRAASSSTRIAPAIAISSAPPICSFAVWVRISSLQPSPSAAGLWHRPSNEPPAPRSSGICEAQ